jgi:hypothetical protein
MVEVDEDARYTSADAGDTGKNYTGIGELYTRNVLSKNRSCAAASAFAAGDNSCYAEVWKNITIQNPTPGLGPYSAPADITFSGFWSAFLEAIVGGAFIRAEIFVRGSDVNKSLEIVEKSSSLPGDIWSGNDSYTQSLGVDLTTGRGYELGVRAKVGASALATAQGLADMYTGDSGLPQYTGRHEFDYIDLHWL